VDPGGRAADAVIIDLQRHRVVACAIALTNPTIGVIDAPHRAFTAALKARLVLRTSLPIAAIDGPIGAVDDSALLGAVIIAEAVRRPQVT